MMMNLARSSFYYKPSAKSRDRLKAEADLRYRVKAICLEFPAMLTVALPISSSTKGGSQP